MRLRKYRYIASGTSGGFHLLLLGAVLLSGAWRMVELSTKSGQASLQLVARLASIASAAEPEPVPVEIAEPPPPAPPRSPAAEPPPLAPTMESPRRRPIEPVAVARKPVVPEIQTQVRPAEVPTPKSQREVPRPQLVKRQVQPKREAEIVTHMAETSPPSPSSVTNEGAQVDELPREAPNNPGPRYPAAALAARQQGRVQLRVRITAAGTVESATVAQSSGFPLLDRSALEAVSAWRFTPAQRAGVAVPFEVLVPILFRIRQ